MYGILHYLISKKQFYINHASLLNAFKSGIYLIKATKGEGLKILIPKQILQKLPIVLPQIKAGNTSENLLNEIR